MIRADIMPHPVIPLVVYYLATSVFYFSLHCVSPHSTVPHIMRWEPHIWLIFWWLMKNVYHLKLIYFLSIAIILRRVHFSQFCIPWKLNLDLALSRWCVSLRKKARQIVETWVKSFNSRQKDQRVTFLYLSNDILQNSRRKGSEFVNEFWKVLPAVLKQVYDNGELGKKAVTRLVSFEPLNFLLDITV